MWGTVVSLHLLGAGDAELAATRDEIVAFLHRVEADFSVGREDSLLMRWQRGEAAATPELQDVLALAGTVSVLTHGSYDVRWNGAPDPSGVVMGWAVDRVVEIAARHGVANLVVNAGGNISTRGASGSGRPWQVVVADPVDPQRVALTVLGNDVNVASAGGSDRIHCVRERTARLATVMGPNLAVADGIATAAVAAGSAAPSLLTELDESGWLSQVIGLDGSVWRSPKFAELMGS